MNKTATGTIAALILAAAAGGYIANMPAASAGDPRSKNGRVAFNVGPTGLPLTKSGYAVLGCQYTGTLESSGWIDIQHMRCPPLPMKQFDTAEMTNGVE